MSGGTLSTEVYLCADPYFSKLPHNTGRFGLPITGAVPHPDGRLSVEYFSTQLRHRVETDLLLRCVFKVLEQKRETGLFSLNIQREYVILCREMEIT